MTPIERQLAKTFRAARWAESGGQPVCPDCFEGDALVVDQPARLKQPGLHSYRCRDCNQRFSDLSGTPLRGSAQSLREWALALLTLNGGPTEVRRIGVTQRLVPINLGVPPARLNRMRARWMESQVVREAWLQELRAAQVTLRKLECGAARS